MMGRTYKGTLLSLKKDRLPFATTWVDLEDVTLHEMSLTQKDHCTVSLPKSEQLNSATVLKGGCPGRGGVAVKEVGDLRGSTMMMPFVTITPRFGRKADLRCPRKKKEPAHSAGDGWCSSLLCVCSERGPLQPSCAHS